MVARIIPIVVSFVLLSIKSSGQDRNEVTVYFEFNRSALTTGSRSVLDNVLKKHKSSYTDIRATITGYCDNTGSNEYNDSLSKERAETVKNYLLQHGLDSSLSITVSGSGETAPLNKNSNEKERALNRRVSLVLFKETTAPATVIADPATAAPTIGELTRQITSDSVKEGSEIVMQNMNFHGGTHVLRPGSFPVLKELLTVLNANPKLKIEIQGHVCCTKLPDGLDNDLGTYDLSVQRAKAIFQYLVVNGIEASRLSYKGFGSSKRLYPEEINEEQQALNRRVEIKIIAK